MRALIDGDLIAYRCAASCQSKGEVVHDFSIAQARANNLLVNIKDAVAATEHRIFLSGGENFRKLIYPDYKANRNDQERPIYLEPLREWLVTEWGAKVTDGIEADDAMGIAQSSSTDGTTIICSLDKDMLQVPGWHYQWEIQGTGSTGKKWVKEASTTLVDPLQGQFNFYWQLVMGDRADNVPGYDGKMRAVVPKFMEMFYHDMQDLPDENELFNYVLDLYDGDYTTLIRNGRCLWIQREENDDWLNKAQKLLEQSSHQTG